MNTSNKKIKVMYIVFEFPQLSQTYIKNEIEALVDFAEINVISLAPANLAYENYHSFTLLSKLKDIVEKIREFDPDVLHSHWINMTPIMNKISLLTGIPYTIRAHSFDVLGQPSILSSLRQLINTFRLKPVFGGFSPNNVSKIINMDNCLGVLSFPFTRKILNDSGVKQSKIFDCFPVISRDIFLNVDANGTSIMNVGACIPKKKMENFIDLSLLVPDRNFNLYSIGYQTEKIAAYNQAHGSPVNILDVVQPELMPAEYKKHQWLVYTADKLYNTVGWPMALAEAQASGVGVCLPNLRPDLNDYIGGAGVLYDSVEQLADIIRQDVPKSIRDLGFEVSKKSDIKKHINMLLSIWRNK